MSKYRFKTKEEFIRDGQWDYEHNVPVEWPTSGEMNSFLGADIIEDLTKVCDSKGSYFLKGWHFSSKDYVLKEENKNWAEWVPTKEVNTNGFEYLGDTLMEVSEDKKRWITRVVFGKKNGLYIAWAGGGGHNLEGARSIDGAISWKYARRIKTKLTIQEIADKFGLDKNEIEIVDYEQE